MRVTTDKNDALNFKPDVEDLESSEDEQETEVQGVYKAPRIAAAHYYEPGMWRTDCERGNDVTIFRSHNSTFVFVTRDDVLLGKGSSLVLILRRARAQIAFSSHSERRAC